MKLLLYIIRQLVLITVKTLYIQKAEEFIYRIEQKGKKVIEVVVDGYSNSS